MKAYAPPIYEALGIFLPLIVVNCIILARAEAFASKNGIVASIVDGIGMGIGYTVALVVLGAIREIFGAGTFLGKAGTSCKLSTSWNIYYATRSIYSSWYLDWNFQLS